MTRLQTAIKSAACGSAFLLAGLLVTACGEKTETPVTQESTAGQVETTVSVEQEGSMTSAVVVEASTPESDAAFIATTEVQTLTAKVVSINQETREVVLAGEEGNEIELTVREDTRNLDQVNVGDTVNARFIERVSIELVKGEDLRALNVDTEQRVQAEDGQMPARAEVKKNIEVFTVEAIDIEANTFVLKDVDGDLEEFTARDPANLAKAEPGDAVVVVTTEAMAVEVLKVQPEQ